MKQIDYTTLKSWKQEQKIFQLIDVREADEHAAYNLGGILIPLSEILREKKQIQLDRPVVFYCKRGIRSQLAIQKLSRFFPDADFYNLTNGISPPIKTLPITGRQ